VNPAVGHHAVHIAEDQLDLGTDCRKAHLSRKGAKAQMRKINHGDAEATEIEESESQEHKKLECFVLFMSSWFISNSLRLCAFA
jgi:hypothetical protein